MKKMLIALCALFVLACKKDKNPEPDAHVNALPVSVAIYAVNEDATEELLEKYTFFYSTYTFDSIWKEMPPSEKVTFKGTDADPAYDAFWGTQSRILRSYQDGVLNTDIGVLIIRLKDSTLQTFVYGFDCNYEFGNYMEFYNTFDGLRRITRTQGSSAPECGETFTYTDIAYDDPGQKLYTWLYTGIDDCGEDLNADTSVYLADKFSYLPVLSFPYVQVGDDGHVCGPIRLGLQDALQLHLLLPNSDYVYPMLNKVYSGKYLLDYEYAFNADGDVTQMILTYKSGNIIVAQWKYVFTY